MVVCSAPGKLILFGEHAVVFGEPALSIAINLRTKVEATSFRYFSVNDVPLEEKKHGYVKRAIDIAWQGPPLKLKIDSEIPPASGMGSSAAVTVATLGALLHIKKRFGYEEIAKKGFEIEYGVQGRASPLDTSTCTHGSGVLIGKEKQENFLWKIEKGGKQWFVHDFDFGDSNFVVGNTGINAPTGPLVEKVKRFADKRSFARDIIREIGQITLEGWKAFMDQNYELAGRLMTRNHKLLAILGVSHPLLDRMVDASLKVSYGAKLTGAGGGGSMIALTHDPEKVSEAIKNVGGTPIIVKGEKKGVVILE